MDKKYFWQRSKKQVNQCQGRQAGWPTVDRKLKGKSDLHKVEGGYKGELIACTKDKYEG